MTAALQQHAKDVQTTDYTSGPTVNMPWSFPGYMDSAVLTISDALKQFTSSISLNNIHAPFENFLRTWYYVPITIWWKTFAPPMFLGTGSMADGLLEALDRTEALQGQTPFMTAGLNQLSELSKTLGSRFDVIDKDVADALSQLSAHRPAPS